jgi:hypothetical protein
MIDAASSTDATLRAACGETGILLRTLKRWRKAFLGDGDGEDRRRGSPRHVATRLSEEECQRILLTCTQPEYASLPQGQIVPTLAHQGLFIGSESSFSRVLHKAGQFQRSGRARRPQEPRSVPRLSAVAPMLLGRGTSPICPPRCGACGCVTPSCSMSGAVRWWPGMSRCEKIQTLQPIW